VAVFVYRDLKLYEVPKVLLTAAAMSAMLLYIITNAVLFSFLMTSEQIPQAMAHWMTTQGLSFVIFMLLVNVILLAAGNFMDPAAIVLIMAPILFPVTAAHGGEYGSGALPPARRAQSVCGVQHHQDGDRGIDDRGAAVAFDHAGLFAAGDFCPRYFALAASSARAPVGRIAKA
jgi:hypothetical protein